CGARLGGAHRAPRRDASSHRLVHVVAGGTEHRADGRRRPGAGLGTVAIRVPRPPGTARPRDGAVRAAHRGRRRRPAGPPPLLPRSIHTGVVAILVAHVLFNIAVVVRGVGTMWEQLPPNLVNAARTLGASPWRGMRTVTLPLLAPAIAASASVVFLFTFTSFGVVRILGGQAHPTIEVEIWQRATRLGDV